VFGDAAGSFAEYLVVPASKIAHKPANLSFEDAAAVPWAAAALQGLRDAGGLKAGQKVLINGASGGVGTWAVQIAKALGAHVTAVCSTRNVEMVRALGADAVIDYTKEDFVDGGARFDLMLDAVGNRSLSDCRSVVVPKGTFVSCAGGGSAMRWLFRMAQARLTSFFTSQKLVTLATSPNLKDLLFIKELVEAGKVKPFVDRRYGLSEVAEALRHVGTGHTRGQTVIRIAD
jgi:NADPH:quinone reductase-like Zn-dependent oxidoreductase